MLERLILKVELNINLTGTFTDREIEVDFDSAFGDWSELVRLAELNVVSVCRQVTRRSLGFLG